MLFWERFSELCGAKGLRPNPVAAEIGIGSGTLSKWKKEKTFPNGETLIKISKYFNCSVDYLLGISDIKFPAKNEILPDELAFLEKLRALPEDSQDEVMYLVNYKYEQQQKKRENFTESSPSAEMRNNNIAG